MNSKVFSKGNLIKIIAVAMLCPLVLLCGCKDKDTKGSVSTVSKNKTSANSKSDKFSEPTKKGTDYILIGVSTDTAEHTGSLYQQVIKEDKITYGAQMKRIMETYGDQDVLLHYVVAFKLKDRESPLKDVDKFAKDIGAFKVYYGDKDRPFPVGAYGVIGTPQTVRNIEKAGYSSCFVQMLKVEAPRPRGYTDAISDSLATLLEQMDDDEKIEIVATTVVSDQTWAYRYSHMPSSNQGRGKSFESFDGLKTSNKDLSYDECTQLAVKFTNNIVLRNNISKEKLLDGKVIAGVSGTKEDFAIPNSSYGKPQDHIYSGFAARLTKAEILALAEDADIQLIHNDTVISTYTVYEE